MWNLNIQIKLQYSEFFSAFSVLQMFVVFLYDCLSRLSWNAFTTHEAGGFFFFSADDCFAYSVQAGTIAKDSR